MKTFLHLDVWRHEVRILGPVLFAIPVGLAGFFATLTVMMFVGSVNHSFIASFLIACIEACLPLAMGILLSTVAVQDASLELLLTMLVAYRVIAFARFLLVLGWTLLLDMLATLAMYAFLPWVAPEPLAAGQLTWLAPSLWLAGVGIMLALVFRSRASSGAILGCVWIIQLLFHGYFAHNGWTEPWFLFATLYTPGALSWLANRLELIATALALFVAARWFLRNPERRFFAEEA